MPKILVTEEQWVQLGVELFSTGGADALVVEKMAKQLKCSKSSFYWYFKDRESFLHKIFEHWRKLATEAVIRTVETSQTPADKIRTLLTTMFEHRQGNDFMFYLRRLGQRENGYREALEAIEEQRMAYFSSLLQEAGCPRQAAREKAELVYHYYLGWFERSKQAVLDDDEARRQVKLIWEHVLKLHP